MKKSHKEYLKLNKNILIAFAASILISAVAAQLLGKELEYINTTLTLVVDYAVFFSVFGFLYYFDNRKKYVLDSGKRNWPLLKSDLVKIVSSLGIAEVVYTIVRWLLQYYFLLESYDPYMASLIAQGSATAVYMVVVNVSVKLTRLYKDASSS